MKKRKCEFCGESINKNENFCKNCGNEIKNEYVVEDAVIEDPNKKHNTFLLIIIVALLLIIVLFGLFYLLFLN